MIDREQELINALKVVFPESAILICEWHINTDIKAKLRRDCGARFHQVHQYDDAGKLSHGDSQDTKDFMKDWFHLIHSQDEDSFNSRLLGFEQKYPYMKAYLDKNWWGYKEYFVYSWTSQTCHFLEKTSSRGEGAHNQVKMWLDHHANSDFYGLFEKLLPLSKGAEKDY